VILLSLVHSLDASHKAIITEWFVDVATNISFVDLQEIAAPPPHKKHIQSTRGLCADLIDTLHLYNLPWLNYSSSGRITSCLVFLSGI
jgi:hypothetical protein